MAPPPTSSVPAKIEAQAGIWKFHKSCWPADYPKGPQILQSEPVQVVEDEFMQWVTQCGVQAYK